MTISLALNMATLGRSHQASSMVVLGRTATVLKPEPVAAPSAGGYLVDLRPPPPEPIRVHIYTELARVGWGHVTLSQETVERLKLLPLQVVITIAVKILQSIRR